MDLAKNVVADLETRVLANSQSRSLNDSLLVRQQRQQQDINRSSSLVDIDSAAAAATATTSSDTSAAVVPIVLVHDNNMISTDNIPNGNQPMPSSMLSMQQLTDVLREDLQALSSALTNMSSTTGFMLMNINRIIDFSKASRGISLIPRPETFSFEEAMTLPLNCCRDLHPDADIRVKIDYGDGHLCPFVITDKQWFQENLLCLVSNAVKFSPPQCVVKVNVRLNSGESGLQTPLTRLVSSVLCSLVVYIDFE